MKYLFLTLQIYIIISCSSQGHAEQTLKTLQTDTINAVHHDEEKANQIYSFANHLFISKDYYRAITEYSRFLFFFPKHKLAPICNFKIAHSYMLGKKWDEAITNFKKLKKEHPKSNLNNKALFLTGEIYYKIKDFKMAIYEFENFLRIFPKDELADQARINICWANLYLGNYFKSSLYLRKIEKKSKYYEQANLLEKEVNKFPYLSLKSPVKAGIMSAFFFGSGQAYTGRYNDAFLSFLLNGLFTIGTIESIKRDNIGSAVIFGFFELGWYTGNIYNAVSNAHKYNRNIKQNFINKLKEKYPFSIKVSKTLKKTRLAFVINF